MSLNLKRNVFALTVVLAIAVIAVWLYPALKVLIVLLAIAIVLALVIAVWAVWVIPSDPRDRDGHSE